MNLLRKKLYNNFKSQVQQNFCGNVIYFVVLLNQVIVCNLYKTCPEENSTIVNSKNAFALWKSTKVSEIVFSTPPCIDKDQKVVTRFCANGTWFPTKPPLCEVKLPINKDCPEFLIESKHYCISISKPGKFDSNCNLDTKNLVHVENLEHDSMWLPLKRKVKFGPYEFIHYGKEYGESKYNFTEIDEDFLEKDCILYNIKKDICKPEFCNKKHHNVCAFSKKIQLKPCPEDKSCISAGIGTSECYCKSTNCESEATITTPFQKKLLTDLVGDDVCTLRNNQIISKNVWTYKSNLRTNCSICLTRAVDILPELVLSFDSSPRELYLFVYKHESVLKDGIYCFTDAADDLKKKIKIEKKIAYYKKSAHESSFFVYKVALEKYIGDYWCEAHLVGIEGKIITSNVVLAYKKKKGQEYALRLIVNNAENLNCTFNQAALINSRFIDPIIYEIFEYLDPKIRVMEIFQFDRECKLDFLLHITTNKRDRDIVHEYDKLNNKLNKIPQHIKLVYFRSSEYCFSNVMNYSLLNTNSKLTWPLTKRDASVVPDEDICNNAPLTRVCSGSFLYGAEWSQVINHENCLSSISSNSTKFIKSLLSLNIITTDLEELKTVTKNTDALELIDIYYLSKVFKKINEIHFENITSDNFILDCVNNLFHLGTNKLKKSQLYLNLTDEMLLQVDNALIKINATSYKIIRDQIITHITNPFLTNVSGIALVSSKNGPELLEITRNQSFENLADLKNIEVAVYVPENIIEHISNVSKNISDVQIITTIYLNDKMFTGDNYKPQNYIVSINIPGYSNYLNSPLPVMFRALNASNRSECGFWDFGKNSRRKKGQWSKVGGNNLGRLNIASNFHICTFSHLTHFALLIIQEDILFPNRHNKTSYFSSKSNSIYIITLIGSVLSSIGVAAIFLTAALFSDWRQRQGTKILMNISVAILLETLTTQFSEIENIAHSNFSCAIIGMSLHYSALCKFSWMLIYAFLQYLRFVKVLGPTPKKLLLKCVLFGWGFPLFPVMFVSIFNPSTYSYEDYHFCYPRNLALYLTVLLPVSVVVLTNFVIFCVVMYQVSHRKIRTNRVNDNHRRQLQLATLLFFMLGLPYLFGLTANFVKNELIKMIFVYVFCITATLQGFILFLFYVVFNKETRLKWQHYILNL